MMQLQYKCIKIPDEIWQNGHKSYSGFTLNRVYKTTSAGDLLDDDLNERLTPSMYNTFSGINFESIQPKLKGGE